MSECGWRELADDPSTDNRRGCSAKLSLMYGLNMRLHYELPDERAVNYLVKCRNKSRLRKCFYFSLLWLCLRQCLCQCYNVWNVKVKKLSRKLMQEYMWTTFCFVQAVLKNTEDLNQRRDLLEMVSKLIFPAIVIFRGTDPSFLII